MFQVAKNTNSSLKVPGSESVSVNTSTVQETKSLNLAGDLIILVRVRFTGTGSGAGLDTGSGAGTGTFRLFPSGEAK